MQILEREPELAELAVAAREAARGAGSVALVSGEAGIGKSSVVEAARAVLPARTRVLVGYCDDLATPRTLGPFRDLAGDVGGGLAQALRQGAGRDALTVALYAELDQPRRPAMLVVEDVHWADEASLDVLGHLVRRVARLPAVVVLTYRDELAVTHPLRRVLGLAASAGRPRRLALRPLSERAVRELAAAGHADAGDVHAVTAGNPFFVAEILAAGTAAGVPASVVDAVLARLRHLDRPARDALEQLAVVPSTLDRWLIDAVVPGGLPSLAAAERHGLLAVHPDRVVFRHELTRRAIVDALPAARRVDLNRRVLAALARREGTELARLVHHAAQAGDQDAVARYAPPAAREASRAGAHREAAAHLRLVLEQQQRYPAAERADLLGQYAIECYTIGDPQPGVDAQRTAVELRRTLGDARALGADLRWLSRICWWNGDRDDAERAAAEATAILETAGDARTLALAYSNQAQLYMIASRHREAIFVGERAAAIARRAGDAAITSHALTNVGSARANGGEPAGLATLVDSLRVALNAGVTEEACRAYNNLASQLLAELRLAEAEKYIAAGIDLADRGDQLGYLGALRINLAGLRLAQAFWDQAVAAAESAPGAHPLVRADRKLMIGLVRVRTGQPGGESLLREAWQLVEGREWQWVGPLAAARAEEAWLRGDRAVVHAIAGPAHAQACRLGDRRLRATLGYWLAKAGQPVTLTGLDHPFALQATGCWREAADRWRAASFPYQYAAAMAESPEPGDQLAALAELDALGAGPLARIVRDRLRKDGLTGIPRGPNTVTRQNPANLTDRQLQVLRLLGHGLTNTQIADQLVISARTVDRHVAAVLHKLGTRTRHQAVDLAIGLGIVQRHEHNRPACG